MLIVFGVVGLKKSLTNFYFPVVPLILFIVSSDIYIVGFGRIFDYVGIIFVLLIIFFIGMKFSRRELDRLYFFWGCCVLVTIPGFLKGNIAENSAFLVGGVICFTYGWYITRNFSDEKLVAVLSVVVCFLSFFLLFQFFYYHLFGSFIDFSRLLGSLPSRGMNYNINYMRPSGLFQEPNSFVSVMFGLLFLVTRLNGSFLVFYLGIASVFVSQSIWGFGVILFLIFHREHRFLLRNFFFILIIATVMALLFLKLEIVGPLDGVMFNRLSNILNDKSFNDRLGVLVGNGNIPISALVFGEGIDTNGFQQWGANGFSFLVYSLGFLGSFIFLIFFLNFNFHWSVLGLILCYFLTFPLFSYMYFWVYFGLIAGRVRTYEN